MSNVRAVNIASKALRCSRWRSPVSLISVACPKPLQISPFLPFLYPSSHPNSHTISLRSFQRPLSTTNALRKSKNKDKVNKHNASNIDRAEAKVAATTDDPFDFTQYEADITRAQEDLKAQLAKIRVNALDAEAVESLRVTLGPVKAESGGKKAKGGGGGEEKVTIGDVASVMKRGRNIVIMVGEKDHLKPVLRSLHSLPSSPNPTPGSSSGDADPLHITLPIPPTTGEDRLNAAKRAEELGPRALHQLREARGAQLKRLRAMELTGKVGPDNMRRAKTRMEGVSERAGGEAKKVVEEVRKRLERG